MPGFDDPRYLQQVITQLQQKVKKLERDTLPLLSHQRGPTPGWLNAGQIGPGPGMKSAMHLNMDGNQAGVAPRQTVTDANGTVRVELGNLAANGNSPAQLGFRANDASANPIFDSLGLIAVMKVLGSRLSGGGQTFTTASWVLMTGGTGSSITFSLARTTNILVLAHIQGNTTTNNGQMIDFVDGVISPGAAIITQWGVGGPLVDSPLYDFLTLGAGSHTIDLRGQLSATPGSFQVTQYMIVIFQLGG